MNEQKIIEKNNRLIAEFMNSDSLPRLYDTDWNRLMPVVKKIGNLHFKSGFGFRIEIVNGYTKIEGTGERLFFNSCTEGSMLNATYKACVEFIKRSTDWNLEGGEE